MCHWNRFETAEQANEYWVNNPDKTVLNIGGGQSRANWIVEEQVGEGETAFFLRHITKESAYKNKVAARGGWVSQLIRPSTGY